MGGQTKIMNAFLSIFHDAIDKILEERKKHGDSWEYCPLEKLINYLREHVNKIMEYKDALDIINYGLFIAKRLKE